MRTLQAEVGLFDGTVAENIATVPHLLGWSEARIRPRLAHDQPVGEHRAILADPVRAVDGLGDRLVRREDQHPFFLHAGLAEQMGGGADLPGIGYMLKLLRAGPAAAPFPG